MEDLRKFLVTFGQDPANFADGQIQELKQMVILANTNIEARMRLGKAHVFDVQEGPYVFARA